MIGRKLRDGNIIAYQMLKPDENPAEVLRRLLRQAVNKGVNRRNCYLCSHVLLSSDFPRVYCLKKSRDIPYSEADRCMYYEVVH